MTFVNAFSDAANAHEVKLHLFLPKILRYISQRNGRHGRYSL